MRIVMKFGGSLLDNEKKLLNVINIIKSYYSLDFEIVVVASALYGITDKISTLCDEIKQINRNSLDLFLENIQNVHINLVEKVIQDKKEKEKLLQLLKDLLNEFREVLLGIFILKDVTPKSRDYLFSFGERLSTPIVSFALKSIGINSVFLNGKEVGILTDSNFGDAKPLINTTKLRVHHKIEPFLKEKIIPVVTGFIGFDQNGNTTTIGRGGSDYSATIIAASINANEVWLWGDIDGLMTADTKIVKNALVLEEISFSEALELSMFGSKYMHPRALEPVMDSNISVRIRNANNRDNGGTLITQVPTRTYNKIVKSITVIRNTALIDVSGGGLIGSLGTAAKIFDALAKNQVNIMMISQTPSESSITIVVKKQDVDKAIMTLELNFLGKLIKRIDVNENVAIIAVVGAGMRGIKGVAAKTFGAVAKRDINVIMITQGSSELNLAFVIEDKNCEEAVNVLHQEFINIK
ncbi:MAG TPA: aspartate kinase [Nitrososphaeraceae archaeon]|nr:aspartate kinase [Nitrososphaeraceae archaeon]